MLLLALALAACGGGDDGGTSPEAAGEFAADVMDQRSKNQLSRLYDTLHPNQQAVVPRELFESCPVNIPAVEVEVDEVFEEPWTSPEVPEADTHAVTLKLTSGDSEQFVTMHVYTVDDEFRWVLNDESMSALTAGECG